MFCVINERSTSWVLMELPRWDKCDGHGGLSVLQWAVAIFVEKYVLMHQMYDYWASSQLGDCLLSNWH